MHSERINYSQQASHVEILAWGSGSKNEYPTKRIKCHRCGQSVTVKLIMPENPPGGRYTYPVHTVVVNRKTYGCLEDGWVPASNEPK